MNGSYRKNVALVNLSWKGVTEHKGERCQNHLLNAHVKQEENKLCFELCQLSFRPFQEALG